MLTSDIYLPLGLHQGSIGVLMSYTAARVPIVRFEGVALPMGHHRGSHGVHDAGEIRVEVECAPVKYDAKLLAHLGMMAERYQVPFVLGWAITVHRSQSLTLRAGYGQRRHQSGGGQDANACAIIFCLSLFFQPCSFEFL